MSVVDDDDYPDMDLTTSSVGNDSDIQNHLIGAPPDSDIDYSEDNDMDDTCETSGSGSEPFPIDDYEYTVNPPISQPEPLPAMPQDLVSIQADDLTNFGLKDFIGNPVDIIRVFFASSLVSHPLKLRNGFEPEELDKCVREVMGFCLTTIGVVLLGDKMDTLANTSNTEVAHALAKAGWLECKNSKFFPVLPETEREIITSLIEGSEKLVEREDRKKKEAETYKDAESEIRALLTFNMIVDLMHKVREFHSARMVTYQDIHKAFIAMVDGTKYKSIWDQYQDNLKLESSMTWNNEWFNKFTNRSTLKKFVQMAKFSEIVPTDSPASCFYFRADDDGNRPVVKFTDEDIRVVRDKFASGNEKNTNYGNNNVRGGQRGERNGTSYYQKPKKTIEKDPHYRSSTFAGEITSTYDDGSLEPSTSSRRYENQPSTSNRGYRRSPEPSPVREEIKTVEDNRFAQDERSESPQSNPERPHHQVIDPFAGAPAQKIKEDDRNKGNTGGGYQSSQPIARVQDYGETSSEGEFTSEGSYSDEDEEDKVEKRKRRINAKNLKNDREMRRREKHKQEQERQVPQVTRFQTHSFYNTARRSPEPKSRPRAAAPLYDISDSTPSNHQTAPVERSDVVKQATYNHDDNRIPPPLSSSTARQLTLAISSSQHDEEHTTAQVPYRPAEGVMEKNKAIEDEKRRREELNECRAKDLAAQAGAQVQHPYLSASSNQARPVAASQDAVRIISEPLTPNGFANRNRVQPTGMNRQEQRPLPQAPGQQIEQQLRQQSQQTPSVQQQYQQPSQPIQHPQQVPQPQQQFQQALCQQVPQQFQKQSQPSQSVQEQYQQPPQPIQHSQQFPPAQQQYGYPQQQQRPFQTQPMQPTYQDQSHRGPDYMSMNDPSYGDPHLMNRQSMNGRMPGSTNQYSQPSYQMNESPQQHPSFSYNRNSHQVSSNDYRYMQNGPQQPYQQQPTYQDQSRREPRRVPDYVGDQPVGSQSSSFDPWGNSNSMNFNRPQMSFTSGGTSTSRSYSMVRPMNEGRAGSNPQDDQMKYAVMSIYDNYQRQRRRLYIQDLEHEVRNSEFSRAFPRYFDVLPFIENEMRGQLVVERTNSGIFFRIP